MLMTVDMEICTADVLWVRSGDTAGNSRARAWGSLCEQGQAVTSPGFSEPWCFFCRQNSSHRDSRQGQHREGLVCRSCVAVSIKRQCAWAWPSSCSFSPRSQPWKPLGLTQSPPGTPGGWRSSLCLTLQSSSLHEHRGFEIAAEFFFFAEL